MSVTEEWHRGADRFLRQRGSSNPDSERFLVVAAFDSLDDRGLWVTYREHDASPLFTLFIQWRHIITIALADDLEDVRNDSTKFGFKPSPEKAGEPFLGGATDVSIGGEAVKGK
ncbi:MAG: hypothetical protein ABSF22_03785 [Bryobacteraceae bacterium]